MSEKQYRYNSIEYQISQSIEGLQKALVTAEELSAEIGQVQQIKSVDFSGQLMANVCSYKPSRFQGPELDATLQKARETLQKKRDETELLHGENIPKIEINKQVEKTVNALMSKIGIYQTYKKSYYKTSRSRSPSYSKHDAGYISDLRRCVKTSDGYEAARANYNKYEKKIDEYKKAELARLKDIENKKKQEDQQARKLVMALELAKKYGIDQSKVDTNETLFLFVDEIAEQKFIEENYPDGTEMDISCCQECSSWTVGEQRCSCGNRRIYLDVEGDFFYGYGVHAAAD